MAKILVRRDGLEPSTATRAHKSHKEEAEGYTVEGGVALGE